MTAAISDGSRSLSRRLLADDVLVAQRQRDLPERLLTRAEPDAPADARDQARRTMRARAVRRRRADGCAHALIVSSIPASTSSNSCTVPSLRTVKSARSAFSSCGSWRDSREATPEWPRSPIRSARRSSSRDHRDRVVEALLHAGLEQQRDLHHRGRRRRRRGSSSSWRQAQIRSPDLRPDVALEPRAPVGVGEDEAGHRVAVDPAVRRDLRRRSARPARRAPRRWRAARARPRRSTAWRRRRARVPRVPRTCPRRCRRSARRTGCAGGPRSPPRSRWRQGLRRRARRRPRR